MFWLLITICVMSAASAAPREVHQIEIDPTLNWKIVGGNDAPDSAFPFIVSLRKQSGVHLCGGSIISENYILTAEHCVNGSDPAAWTVVAGVSQLNSSGIMYKVSEIIVHEDYELIYIGWISAINDIALLKTETPINLSHQKVSAVNLPQENSGASVNVTAAGWGTLEYEGILPNNLQFLNARTLSYERCKDILSPNPIFESQLCAFGASNQGICHGDSGGPLVSTTKKTLVGIASWVIPCARGYPDVFTRIYSFLDWIQANAKL